MDVFLRWARTARTVRQRVGFLVLGGVVFLAALPACLCLAAPRVDAAAGAENLLRGPVTLVAGCLLMAAGGALALWTIAVQVTVGSGTPIPVAPTQRLLVRGPFAWSRNPMAGGTIVAYLGLSLAVGSLAALLSVAVLGGLLLLFIKRVEERELALRFGDAYLRYRAATPFLIPRPPAHRAHGHATDGGADGGAGGGAGGGTGGGTG